MKRGTDHSWEIRKYKADISWYAHCKCGFQFPCSHSKRADDGSWTAQQELSELYNYCPCCGARKKIYTDLVKYDNYPWDETEII